MGWIGIALVVALGAGIASGAVLAVWAAWMARARAAGARPRRIPPAPAVVEAPPAAMEAGPGGDGGPVEGPAIEPREPDDAHHEIEREIRRIRALSGRDPARLASLIRLLLGSSGPEEGPPPGGGRA